MYSIGSEKKMKIYLYKQAGIQAIQLDNITNFFITSNGYIEVTIKNDIKQTNLYRLSDYFAISVWND